MNSYRKVITSIGSWTPMHASCFYNQVEITKLMLETDLNNITVAQYYVTPLQSPAYNKQTAIGWSPVFYTTSIKVIEVILHTRQILQEDSLCRLKDLSVVTQQGVPLLWECAGRGLVSETIVNNLMDQLCSRQKGILPLENGKAIT